MREEVYRFRVRKNAAFTLLEVVCAVGIAAVVMMALLGSLSVTIRGFQQAHETIRSARVASGLERIMRRDLKSAYTLTEKGVRPLVGSNPDMGSLGMGEEARFLEFFSTNSFAPPGRTPGTGLVRIEYILRPSGGPDGGYDVLRKETPYMVAKPPGTAASLTERLAGGIALWTIRFFDGTEWRDEWRRTSLPPALRVNFALEQGGDAADSTETIFFAPIVDTDGDPLPPDWNRPEG